MGHQEKKHQHDPVQKMRGHVDDGTKHTAQSEPSLQEEIFFRKFKKKRKLLLTTVWTNNYDCQDEWDAMVQKFRRRLR